MMPVVPCSVSNTSFIHGHLFTTRKKCFTRYNFCEKPMRRLLLSQRHFISLSHGTTVFQQLRNRCSNIQKLSATGTDISVEEQGLSAMDEASAGPPERTEERSIKSDVSTAPARAKRRRGRKSEMPPVKKEDLVIGVTFTGKVRSIQPFGAFVDFGAFADGLVHVSQLSHGFVKDVNNVVSLGQEVKVRLIEVNDETGRISLSMRDEDSSKSQQKKDGSSDIPRSPRRGGPNKSIQKRGDVKKTKFVLGQDLVGTVKNFGRSGAFISLPEGEEGFLPTSEEPDDGFGNVMGNSSLEVGQEVSVRILRITRGTVTLTMKKEEDVVKLDSNLNQGVVHTATNPFVVAFRRNKDIAAFLDDREKHDGDASSETASVEDLAAEITPVENASTDMTLVEDASAEIASVEDASPEISSVESSSKDDSEVASAKDKNEDLISEEVSSTSQDDAPVVENEATTQISDVSSSEVEGPLSEASSVSKEIMEESQADEVQLDTSSEDDQSISASSAVEEIVSPTSPASSEDDTKIRLPVSEEVVTETQADALSTKEDVPEGIPTNQSIDI